MTSRLDALKTEFAQVRSAIETLEAVADPTAEQSADLDALFVRAEQIQAEVQPIAERHRSLNAAADALSRVGLGNAAPKARTAGDWTAAEYLASYFRTVDPHADVQSRSAALAEFHARTVAEQLLADNPGVVPVPVVGNLIKLADSRRPCFRSFTARPMPSSGKTFERPVIAQRVNVGEQAAEGDELTSRKMTLSNSTVTKRTFGGTLELSQQDLDWTDPSILSIVLQHFIDVYAEVTETAACTYLSGTLATTSATLSRSTRASWVGSFVDAAVDVYDAAKRWPDTIWLGTSAWSVMASAVDADDKLIFPDLGSGMIDLSEGGFQGAPLGLRPVLAPSLTATKCIVGSSSLAEVYEQQRGLLRGYQTANLMAEVAYFGYLAFFGKVDGFVKMVDNAATPVIL